MGTGAARYLSVSGKDYSQREMALWAYKLHHVLEMADLASAQAKRPNLKKQLPGLTPGS